MADETWNRSDPDNDASGTADTGADARPADIALLTLSAATAIVLTLAAIAVQVFWPDLV